ncbi:MAG: carboxypeptidase regulatory-like domain-containing protein, partial [Desulfobacterales bacterium]|nr:carboxypeptidase regulatory-like domain-containing protein [Desulfobacterales bacterium]
MDDEVMKINWMGSPAKVAAFSMIVLTIYMAMSLIYVNGALTGTVSGRVVDEYGRGMKNVKISVYSSDEAYVKSGTTSSDGSFNINLDVGKSYTLDFSKEGYAKVTKTATVSFYQEKVKLGTIVLSKALRLSSPVLSRVASPGEKLTLPFTVSNIGEELETVEFLVAKPEGWSTRVLDQIGEVTKIYLSSDVSMSLQLEIAIPTTSPGDYNLSLTAAGKTSSTLNFTIIVEPLSEPLIFCQFPGKSAAPGESVKFQVRVKNPFGVRLRFEVAVDSVPNDWMAIVKSAGGEAVTEANLDSNEFADLIVEVYVPREEADGTYDVAFKASSPVRSENLTLTVNVEKIGAGMGVDLHAMAPYLDAYAGSRA